MIPMGVDLVDDVQNDLPQLFLSELFTSLLLVFIPRLLVVNTNMNDPPFPHFILGLSKPRLLRLLLVLEKLQSNLRRAL